MRSPSEGNLGLSGLWRFSHHCITNLQNSKEILCFIYELFCMFSKWTERKNIGKTRVCLFFFNLSNLPIYFVTAAKSLTQTDRNDFVLKNSHRPTLAGLSSSRKCYSRLTFCLGLLSVIETRLSGIAAFVAKKLGNIWPFIHFSPGKSQYLFGSPVPESYLGWSFVSTQELTSC